MSLTAMKLHQRSTDTRMGSSMRGCQRAAASSDSRSKTCDYLRTLGQTIQYLAESGIPEQIIGIGRILQPVHLALNKQGQPLCWTTASDQTLIPGEAMEASRCAAKLRSQRRCFAASSFLPYYGSKISEWFFPKRQILDEAPGIYGPPAR